MKKFLLISLSLLVSNLIFAQKYGNEWINFNQDYYKIKIGKEGIYRIDSATLQSIGFPLGSVNPKNIQLWINGEEQPILVNGENDGSFNSGDYIEFYGTYNDGKLDSSLYPNPAEQPHQYMSLYSDTATYFLTYTASTQGKRIQVNNDNDYTGKTADPYFLYEQIIWYNNKNGGQSYDGLGFAAEGFHSEYTEGEGWALQFSGGGTKVTFLTPYISISGPRPFLQVLAHSRANNTSSYDANGFNNGIQITFDASGKLIEEKRVTGYNKYYFEDSLDKSDIGSVFTRFKLASSILAKSIHSISYTKLTYPRLFNLNDSSNFHFIYNSTNNFIRFSKYSITKSKPIVYDINNFSKSFGEIIGNELYCNLANSATQKNLYILDQTSIIPILSNNIKTYKFNELKLTSAVDYIIISNHLLDSGANAYKDFLLSANGGNHNPYLSFTDDIYDQFYFGLKHPMALQNFCKFSINNSPSLKFLLLLGKGQKYPNARYNLIISKYLDLVPTYGTPPTDYFFTSGYNGSTFEPLLATGRIPASTNNQIKNYLEKLNNHAQNGYQPWKKNILQLAGGNNASEVKQFSTYQNTFYRISQESKWGASRKLITKQDPSPIDSSLKSKIQSEINNGYGLVDYFGHGSTQASDIDLGSAYQLKNQNKYTFFYFNGCGLGNTFDGSSLAEDFLFTKDKGALGWMAGTTFGYISELYYYAIQFHTFLTQNTDLTFAENIAKTIKSTQIPSSYYNRAQSRQMVYMGDPSIKLFDAEKPDYSTEITKTYIYPRKATADLDSFALVIHIQNTALYTLDSFTVSISQTLPNNKILHFKPLLTKAIGNKDSIIFWIKNNKENKVFGVNTFTISIDTANQIEEQGPSGESNNISSFQHFFSSNNAQILFPKKDAIVNSTSVELIAQSFTYAENSTNFIFEIDTVPYFNSPYKRSSGLINSKYLVKTHFALLPKDSIDYYWRVKIDDGSNNWDVSTFSMIYDSPNGWSQGYKGKFISLEKQDITYDTNFNLNYLTHQSIGYGITSGGKNSGAQRTIWHDGYPLNWGYFVTQGIAVVAYSSFNEERYCMSSTFNQTSKSPWWTIPNSIQNKYYFPAGKAKTCHYLYNTFNKVDRDSFLFLLKNIPPNYNLVIYNGTETNIKNWEQEIFDELSKFGALKIFTLNDGDPFVFVGKRGFQPGEALEKMADPNDQIPTPQQSFTFPLTFDILSDSGLIYSNIIGPAKSWKYFYRTLNKPDNNNDKVKFNIYGITKSGGISRVITDISTREIDLSGVDAKLYPYLKIEADIEDSVYKTPIGIDRWTVLYDGYPEGLINPPATLYQNKDTLEEGDTLVVKIAYSNISAFNMDSVLILTTSINDRNTKDTLELKKYKVLKSNDSIIIVRKLYTKGLSGLNMLTITVNPEMAQPEEYLFNNSWQFSYFIKTDQKNPYLDVVFDGRHITNLDIVSPNPSITISASDENKFFYLNDPSYFRVKLKEPGKNAYRELEVTSDTFNFVSAKGPNDKSKLVFNPTNLKDGIYELAVTVRDVKGNFASDEDYKIAFQVITKSTITNVYPYPNPFTTKTKFIFTLTGDKTPDYLKISVISVSGTIVKEITLDELGPLNIGNNITKYEWNGTDTYGDKLANGVYLYKVTAKLDGKEIELGESAGDTFFKKGFGKLYIMR